MGYLFPFTCFRYCSVKFFVKLSISFVLVVLVMFLFLSLRPGSVDYFIGSKIIDMVFR